MAIRLNMTGVSVKATPLPPGYYQAVVAQCEQKTSQSGNPTLAWQFAVTEPEEFVGRKAFFNTSLQQQALWNLKRTLLALGFEEDDLEGEIDLDPGDLVGIECTLVVIEDEWQGETTGRVDQVLPAGEEE